MPRRLLFLRGVIGAALVLASVAAQSAPVVPCRVPDDLIEHDPLLPRLGERLKAKQPITIVAIGGASTAGTAAGGNLANAYPHRLEIALQRRHPAAPITVVNKGVAGQTAAAMAARFATDVYPSRPDLVIWEAGTVDAIRGTDVETFAAALDAGIAALRAHQAEVMLVDMQYNPGTASVINFEPYLDALHRTGNLLDVALFHRFDIMKYWSDTGVFDFEDVPKGRRAALATEVYRCVGESLADAIDAATE